MNLEGKVDGIDGGAGNVKDICFANVILGVCCCKHPHLIVNARQALRPTYCANGVCIIHNRELYRLAAYLQLVVNTSILQNPLCAAGLKQPAAYGPRRAPRPTHPSGSRTLPTERAVWESQCARFDCYPALLLVQARDIVSADEQNKGILGAAPIIGHCAPDIKTGAWS